MAALSPSDLARLLRLHRKRARLTQAQLADLAGLGVRTIRDLESGRTRRPHHDSVRLLIDALGLNAEDQMRLLEAAEPAEEPERLPSPVQLPPDIPGFTGRQEQLSMLCQFFMADRKAGLAIAAVSGRAGAGKTALAVHLAHRLADRFPDGRLFVSLRGAGPVARDPAEVLASLLRALGVAGHAIPDGLEARAELYRTLLSSRRALVVLDDAAGEAQVRPLLPGVPPSAVLITSRPDLVSLDGVWRLALNAMTPPESIELLRGADGTHRAWAENEAAERIVGLCDHLPLAIRIAGAKLTANPHLPLARLAERLADERRRLDELAQGDLEVRASISTSYSGLDEVARRAYRRLCLLDSIDFPTWVGACLLDVPQATTDSALDRLCEAQLLEATGTDRAGQARYRFHDLVRLHGRERAMEEEPEAERAAALRRALQGWLDRVEPARRALRMGDTEPIAWLDAELSCLKEAVALACRSGQVDVASRIATSLATYFAFRGLFDDWQRTYDLVLAWAPAPALLATLQKGLGDLYTIRDRYDAALDCFARARSGFQQAHDIEREAAILPRIGSVLRLRGRRREALESFERALTLSASLDDRRTWILALLGVATVRLDQEAHGHALACLQRALAASREAGFLLGEARVLRALGMVLQAEGDLDAARDHLVQALALTRQLRDLPDEMHVVQRLGDLSRQQGRRQEAARHLLRCLAHYEETGDRCNTAFTLRSLGELHLDNGDVEPALDCLTRSAEIYERLQMPWEQTKTLRLVAATGLLSGDRDP